MSVAAPHSKLLIAASYLVAGALVLSPLLWATVPPLVDYPAYLARMALLAAPGTSVNYVVHWQLIANLAMDLVVPPLSAAVGVETAGRLFVGATMALLVAGTALLHRALFGRIDLWPLASILFVYNFVLFFGFLNFLFGLGLALLGFAGWIASQDWRLGTRLALFAAVATVLFICHLFAFGVYGLLIGSYEAGPLLALRLPSKPMIGRCSAVFLQFVPAAILWFSNRSAGEPHSTQYGDLRYRVMAVLAPMNFGVVGWTLGPLAATLIFLAWRYGALRLAPRMRWPILAMGATAIAMPHLLYGSSWAEIRLPVALAFVVVASLQPQTSHRWIAWLTTVVVLGLVGVTTLAVTLVWHAMDLRFAEFRAVTQDLPRASRLLVAGRRMPEEWGRLDGVPSWFATLDARSFWHMSDLAVLDRDAFIPTIGLHLAPVAPATRNIAINGNSFPPLPIPTVIEGVSRPATADPADDPEGAYFWADWPHRYDYLLIIDFGDRRNPLPDQLKPFAQGSFFTYYKIVPGAGG